ncbi:MAG: heavy metal translocating P-type ATPase [Armatimonadota bacterium]
MTETYRLTGLSCADCAEKLERRIAALPGVESAQVQFTSAKLTVTHCGAQEQIRHAITDAGYGIEEAPGTAVTSRFRVTGMDCPDCAAGLAARLQKIHGVENVSLNPTTGQLVITHHQPAQEIVHAIEAAGYGAAPLAAPGTGSVREFVRTGKRLFTTTLSGVLLLIAYLLDINDAADNRLIIALFIAGMLFGAYLTVRRGISALFARTVDMNVLMTIAIVGASIIGEWHEGASVAFLYSVSNLLESYTMEKTRRSIRNLMNLAPRDALVRRDGQETRLPVEALQLDDVVIIKPGEKIAVDGVVIEGTSSVNQAPITGESVPVEKSAGDEVYAGTLNELGALEVRVTRLAADSTLARITHLVEEAQAQRAPSQAFIDRFAKYYTPVVLGLAVLLAVVPPLFDGDWSVWFYRALALVVIACPCALVISTPVTIVAAIGNAARFGVLIKGGAFLEAAGRLRAIAFDKTGTLTRGRPEVTDVIPLNGVTTSELLALAAAAEQRSAHPLAAAILHHAREEGIAVPPAADAATLPGRGATARVNGSTIYVGNPLLFAETGISTEPADTALAVLQAEGKTAILVGEHDRVIGIIAAADQLRRESSVTVQALHTAGVRRVAMLTGDHRETARNIAAQVGVDEYMADLLPEDKVNAVRELLQREGAVGMVGDGINDAPALAGATVGIAMGVAGTDTAMETADITLMGDDLAGLPFLVRLSRKALAVIRQNIAFAIAIKLIAIVLAIFGELTLWMAVLADMGASVAVTLNGLRLMGERPQPLVPAACDDHSCGCHDCHH